MFECYVCMRASGAAQKKRPYLCEHGVCRECQEKLHKWSFIACPVCKKPLRVQCRVFAPTTGWEKCLGFVFSPRRRSPARRG